MTESIDLEAMAASFADADLAFSDPEGAAARATAEPMAMYVERAARCPVEWLRDDFAVLLRMDDIRFVNKHHDVEQASKYLGSSRPAIPLGLDGEEHRKYRRLLDPVFTAKRVAPLAENVRALADELIDGFVDDGVVAAYERWCEPLPSTIFLSILGLPVADLDDFLHFKSLTLGNEFAFLPFDEAMARREEAVVWIHEYFNRLLDQRMNAADPGDDLLGWLITTEVEGERLPREDLLDILGLLMIAGLDTVAASLACFLSYLARHPDDRRRLLDDPSLWPSAIEELMRYESPVTEGGRIALTDLELPSGERVPAGTHMRVIWHAANLDPDSFPDPLTVDFARAPNPHIGFASGFHRCLGSHLARMEMHVALEAWHRRIPDYVLTPGSDLSYSGNPRRATPPVAHVVSDGLSVRYERDGAVGVVILDREPVNAYDDAFHVEFQDAWTCAKTDDSRAVVMQATGPHFCVGADVKHPRSAPPGAVVLPPEEEIRLIASVMKPTIAAVHGGCIGGGQRMVWPCDLVFCTEDAFFMDPTATMGIGGIQSHVHTWFYGPRLAKEMIYSGMRLPATRLYAMGQVNRLYPTVEALHDGARAFAHEVAQQDPAPLRQAKRAVDITMDVMGRHYVLSRMGELLDPMPPMRLPGPGAEE